MFTFVLLIYECVHYHNSLPDYMAIQNNTIATTTNASELSFLFPPSFGAIFPTVSLCPPLAVAVHAVPHE